MTKKKTLSDYSGDDLEHEMMRRYLDEHFKRGMTMSQMELVVWKTRGMENPAALQALKAMLARLPLEKPTGKLCPKCGKRTPVKAKDRPRELRTMAGSVTLTRNYHYCESCQLGFYPLDRLLDVPEEGELTREMEKRVLDFAINDVYGECAARWQVHYQSPASENLFRRVVARVGAQCEATNQQQLQEELKPAQPMAENHVLIAEVDGGMLPIRGPEQWKEAKLGLVYRHDLQAQRPVKGSARYVATVNGFGEFAPLFEDALRVENAEELPTVLFIADGAPCNWRLAEQLLPDAVQILDWYHAVQHAVACGKALLGDEHPYLPIWQQRSEALLAAGEPSALIAELMDCVPLVPKRRRDSLRAIDELVRYYRTNTHRMRYALYREHRFPIGSGAVESAHRHVLQVRMKRAGQHWAMRTARSLAALRAAYRTAGPVAYYDGIQRARRRQRVTGRYWRKGHFRYAREGQRDRERCLKASSD